MRRGRTPRAPTFRVGRADPRLRAARPGESPEADGDGVSVAPRENGGARLRAPEGAGEAEPAAPFGRVHPLRRLMSEGIVHVIGAGLAGLSAAARLTAAGVRRWCTRPPPPREGAASPFSMRRSGRRSTTATTSSCPATRPRSITSDGSARPTGCPGLARRSSTSPIFEPANAGGCAPITGARPGGFSTGRGGRRGPRCRNISRRSPCSGRDPTRLSSARCGARVPSTSACGGRSCSPV